MRLHGKEGGMLKRTEDNEVLRIRLKVFIVYCIFGMLFIIFSGRDSWGYSFLKHK